MDERYWPAYLAPNRLGPNWCVESQQIDTDFQAIVHTSPSRVGSRPRFPTPDVDVLGDSQLLSRTCLQPPKSKHDSNTTIVKKTEHTKKSVRYNKARERSDLVFHPFLSLLDPPSLVVRYLHLTVLGKGVGRRELHQPGAGSHVPGLPVRHDIRQGEPVLLVPPGRSTLEKSERGGRQPAARAEG